MKKLLFILMLGLLLVGCADTQTVNTCVTGSPVGFWWGLWNGWTLPFSFIGSLIYDDIAIYAVNNNGGWYDFGFLLGTTIILGGSSNSSKK